MDSYRASPRWTHLFGRLRLGLLVLAVCGFRWPAWATAADQAGQLEIGVRSSVRENLAPAAPGKLYAILSVQMISSDSKNLPPVDEYRLVQHVSRELDRHGFRPATSGEDPEILITVHYGNAWLRNPYLDDTRDAQVVIGTSSVFGLESLANQSIAGSPTQLMNERTPGYLAKVQKGSLAKLYVRVTAWDYPYDPKSRARMRWKTTAVVDDPDHQDLNRIASRMLAASAPYFGRETPEKEVAVYAPPPDGQVKVGTPEVVEPAVPKAGPPSPTPQVARQPVKGAKMKFVLPAGEAAVTLQAFCQQSGEEIIYPAEQIRAIKTNDVHGELTARAALDQMLNGTGLIVVQDEKTGALAVRLAPPQSKLPRPLSLIHNRATLVHIQPRTPAGRPAFPS